MKATTTPRQQRTILFGIEEQDVENGLVLLPVTGAILYGTPRQLRAKLFDLAE